MHRFMSVAFLLAEFMIGTAARAESIALKPVTGHPDTTAKFTGSGFANSEAVDIYVDSNDTLAVESSVTGAISGAVTVPLAAQPGAHYITAVGRRSGDRAKAAFTVSTPWNEQGFGADQLGLNPWENSVTTSNVPKLARLWTYAAGVGAGPVAVSGGRAFVASQNGTGFGVQAISTTTGASIWKAETASVFGGSPALAYGNVYIGSEDGTMYALTAAKGAVVWATAATSLSGAVVSDGVVYAGGQDDKLYAFAATSTAHTPGGTILWTYKAGNVIEATPAVSDGTVYFGASDSKVYAVKTGGSLAWTYTTGAVVAGSPAVSDDTVYIGSEDHKLYALRATDGALRWTAPLDEQTDSSPAVAYGLVFISSDDGKLYAFSAKTGALQWSVTLGGAYSPVSVSVANGIVYAAAFEGSFAALAATTGKLLWRYTPSSDEGYSTPVISDGTVYVCGADGTVHAYATASSAGLRFHRQAPSVATLHPDMSLPIVR